MWLRRWGRGQKTPKLSASALRGALLREDQAGISDPTVQGSLVLGWASPVPPRPAPHLLRRLWVKVRLQQRDRELDLPGAVVGLHRWAEAAGRRCGGPEGGGTRGWGGRAHSRSSRLQPRPQPSALSSGLPAPLSQLASLGTLRPPIGSAPAPSRPPFLPQPGALTPSWLRRLLRGFPPRGRASGVPVVVDSPAGYAGVLRDLGREAGKGAATKKFSKPGQLLGAGKVEGL